MNFPKYSETNGPKLVNINKRDEQARFVMKIKIRYLFFILVALLLLMVCVEYLLGFPRVFSVNKDFDLNSGDEREYVYVCFLKIKEEIKTTPFSREVRRLGIDVPQERKWMPTHTKLFTILRKIYMNYIYGGVPGECNVLIKVFDEVNLSDENRRIILQEIITIFQIGDRKVPHVITEKISDEVGKLLKVEE
jgi:hypothetical protein